MVSRAMPSSSWSEGSWSIRCRPPGRRRLPYAILIGSVLISGCRPADATFRPAEAEPRIEAQSVAQAPYFPGRGSDWERRSPGEMGMDAAALQRAIDLAIASESTAPRDLLENHRNTFGREPMGEAIGPFKERGPATGVILRNGYLIAEWGEPDRVDPTFSVSKSFLSTTVGLAYDDGLIGHVHDLVRDYSPPIVALKGPPGMRGPDEAAPRAGAAFDAFEVLMPFESAHNRKITWDHLLRQTSDWQGTLWGKPDWADRPQGDLEAWRTRERHEPGTHYNYNDVRVNLLALAVLNVLRRPLPEVLKERVMDPIGARDWRWLGYDNSWVVMDGRLVQSVAGGAHWGGGMWISARDMARFGHLTLHRGKWGEAQLLSEEWVEMALTPTDEEPGRGFGNWILYGEPSVCSVACGEHAFYHSGAGPNRVYVDPANDLVVVTRWSGNWNEVIEGVLAAIEP